MVTNETLRSEYTARINAVLDYIDTHLDSELSLETIAAVANFSPYHFHRIFKAMTGETLNRFIQRVRVEKAAIQLLQNPAKTITEIALDCGFSGSAAFARLFRENFGVSASEWRKIRKTDSNCGKTDGNHGKAYKVTFMYFDRDTNHLTWRITMNDTQINVQIKTFEPSTVAYIRHVGPYKGDAQLFGRLIGRLMQWAGPRGILERPDFSLMAVYHDDPDVTEEEKQRLSICCTVPEDCEVGGDVGKMSMPGGTYAVGHFELSTDEYEEAWKAIYGSWLPESGYQPDDRPPFELYLNDPADHPEGKCIVDICVPVKAL